MTWEFMLTKIDKSITAGKIVQILREDRLFLIIDGEPKGAEFARAVKQVWSTIPAKHRDKLKEFWGQHAPFGRPLLEYSNVWMPSSRDVYATAEAFAGEIKFAASNIDPLPFEAMCFIIGHELAHVFQKVKGDRPEFSTDRTLVGYRTRRGRLKSEVENERDADKIAAQWGFPPGPLTLWEHRQRVNALVTSERETVT